MFIETLEDVLVPMSQIRLIGPARKNKHGAWVCAIQMINHGEQSLTIIAGDAEKLASSIIPALPGYELLVAPPPWRPEDDFFQSPIIAWRISYLNGNPSPVTVGNDEHSDDFQQAILMPNGKVEVQHDRTFDAIDGGVEYAKLEHDTKRAKKLTA
jgi:hypothetical protein